MNKSITSIIFLFLISSTFAYTGIWKDSNPITWQIGNEFISIKNVDFTCKNTPTPSIRNEGENYRTRSAPQGNFDQSCQCIRQSASTIGTCAEYKCNIIVNEENNPNCWILEGSFLKKNKLIYKEVTEINPYITASYTTNAVARYPNRIKTIDGYNVEFSINIDTKNGITTTIKDDAVIESGKEITINYNNKILNNLEGGVEVKQLNAIFLVFSKIDDVPVTFKSGSNSIKFTLDNVVGNKKVIVTPYVIIRENGKKIKFAGTEISTTTKVAMEHAIPFSQTEPYNLPEQPAGTSNDLSIIARFNLFIEGLFK